MAVNDRVFRWWLWTFGTDQMPSSDEFVVEEFRVSLGGNLLELSFEGSGTPSPAAAQALADRYVGALKRRLFAPSLRLMTAEEFGARTTPPFGGMLTGHSASREDRERAYRALDEARNELLANADPALRRVYAYLRKTQERDGRVRDSSIFELYKAIETIEIAVGGRGKGRRKRAGEVLGVAKELEAVHQAANTGDERHAPDDPATTPPPADLGRAFENTLAVVRAYEAYLLRGARPVV